MPAASVSLRIGGGFAILVAGALGVLLPLVLSATNDSRVTPAILLLKAFAAGIILALAFVHLLEEAYSNFSALPEGTLYNDFPICGVFVCAGVLLMFIAERCSLDFISSIPEPAEAVELSDVIVPSQQTVHSHDHLVALAAAREAASSLNVESASATVSPAKSADPAIDVSHSRGGADVSHSRGGANSHHNHSHSSSSTGLGHGHAHGMLVVHSGSGTNGGAADSVAARRRVLIARLLEFSIVVHSLVIGLNLGTTTGNGHGHGHGHEDDGPGPQEGFLHSSEETARDGELGAGSLRPIAVLIVVLCFHQLFEGIALGSFIAELRDSISLATKAAMAAVFALTVPVGTWIGIGVASSYDSESVTALWVTGTLNAVTGGMLLYNGLITFLAEEFSRDDLGRGAQSRRLRHGMYAATLFGAACMALLGIWA